MRQAAYGLAQPRGLAVQVISEHSAASDPVTRGAGSAPREPPETYRGPWAVATGPPPVSGYRPAAYPVWASNFLKRMFTSVETWDPVRDCVKRLVSTHSAPRRERRRGGPASGIKVQVFHKQYSEKTI